MDSAPLCNRARPFDWSEMPASRSIVGLLLLTALIGPLLAAERELTLGQKIIAFCRQNLGQQVGQGECAQLVEEAYKNCGAQRRGKDDPNEGDYTWGKLVAVLEIKDDKPVLTGKLTDLQAGDVIQFRDCHFEGPLRDGRRGRYRQKADHHTAVVTSTGDNGQIVHVIQQNEGGNHKVTEATLYLRDLKAGWLRFYRPQPRS